VNRRGENNPDKVDLRHINAIAHHFYDDRSIATLRAVEDVFPHWDETMPKYQTEMKTDTGMIEINGEKVARNMLTPRAPVDFMAPAENIHNCIKHEKVNAYLIWDLIWGCLRKTSATDSFGNNVWVPNNGEYYALAHYSKFIRPNDWCIASADQDGVWATAYRQYKGPGMKDRLIVVMLNTNKATSSATLSGKLQGGASTSYWAGTPSWKTYRTSGVGPGAERVKELTGAAAGSLRNGLLTLSLPAESITTVVIN
jgi:O-glycosyl hydrolase